MKEVTINRRTHLVFHCDKHGEYKVRKDKPNLTTECQICSGRVMTTNSFKEKAVVIHGCRYDYSLVEYVNTKTEVMIVCSDHGPFPQKPNSHLNGKGCAKCAGKFHHTTKSFIEKAVGIHGDLYDYSRVNYQGTSVPVEITCRSHGPFTQKPSVHLQGKGCLPRVGTVTQPPL